MTITNGYTDLTSIKARLGATDTTDDTLLEAIIMAVSREIDAYTERRFFTTTNDETRLFRPEWFDCLYPDDLLSITTLKTDEDGDGTFEVTWATTDYQLWPYNAALDGTPYMKIQPTPNGNYPFPTGYASVQIVGKFGYSSTAPKQVTEACLIQSIRLFRRKDAPFGVVGGGEMGQAIVINKLDPDVEMLLRPFMRLV